MTCTINASASNNLQVNSDGSGVLKVQSNGVTTNAIAWGSYGYVGSGSAPTLRSAYNISSITRTAAGTYTFAFTSATTDANYAVIGVPNAGVTLQSYMVNVTSKSTSSTVIQTLYNSGTNGQASNYDYGVDFVIFGN
jgi:hypothetical protein